VRDDTVQLLCSVEIEQVSAQTLLVSPTVVGSYFRPKIEASRGQKLNQKGSPVGNGSKKGKTRTPGIPTWSPTVVLTGPEAA
jgi:hypothetical protein